MTKNLTGEMLLSRIDIYKKWFDYYQDKKIGKFDCKEIQNKIAIDLPLNIGGYFELKTGDKDKKKVKQFFRTNNYIWCGAGIKESYFWIFYVHFPLKMINDRVQMLLRRIKGR